MRLESIQHYDDGGRYTNPPDHPAEREIIICSVCGEQMEWNELEICDDCQEERRK